MSRVNERQLWPSWLSFCLTLLSHLHFIFGEADGLEGDKKPLSLSQLPAAIPPPPSRYIWNRLPVTVIWISILTILRKTRGLWIVYASLSYCSEEDCTGLCINFWSVSFLIFLFLALADLSMGKKGALGKIFRITSRTLVFYNARLPKLLLKLMRKKIQTDETEQKQLKHRILVNL